MENEINHLNLEEIIPKNNIPHEHVDDYLQNNLIESIKNHGIIQPIVVKKNNDKYEIIDGNRRYFAAKKAGLSKIPALVRNDNENVTRLNLVDDLYSNDLSPIEEAKKYKDLLNSSNITQEQLAKNIGKSQSALANKLRLLNLPIEIQNALNNFEISERHARSLLTVKNEYVQLELLKKIKEKKLTVRELDSEIKNMSNMFIPEEFSNNNVNNGSSTNNIGYNQPLNMFVHNNEMNYNQPNNNIIAENNSNFNNGNMSQNIFVPNSAINNESVIANNNSNNSSSDGNQIVMPTNNGGMNPFFTSNDYVAPTSNNINNNVEQSNPFSSIRMNTTNINNANNNANNLMPNLDISNDTNLMPNFDIGNDNNSNNFNINDYKLPEYENTYNNNSDDNNIYNNDFDNYNPTISANSKPSESVIEYKYVEDNPNYVSVDKPDGVSSVDDVIKILRVSLDKIKNGKIKVDTEEIDYDDTYQITIRIDKKGDFL